MTAMFLEDFIKKLAARHKEKTYRPLCLWIPDRSEPCTLYSRKGIEELPQWQMFK